MSRIMRMARDTWQVGKCACLAFLPLTLSGGPAHGPRMEQTQTLAEWMKAHGINDAGLAERLNGAITRSQVQRLRKRECRPTVPTARAIEAVTGIPAARLVMGDA